MIGFDLYMNCSKLNNSTPPIHILGKGLVYKLYAIIINDDKASHLPSNLFSTSLCYSSYPDKIFFNPLWGTLNFREEKKIQDILFCLDSHKKWEKNYLRIARGRHNPTLEYLVFKLKKKKKTLEYLEFLQKNQKR